MKWDNSWNLDATAPNNHDAVWVFAKFRKDAGIWQHLYLSNDTGFAASDADMMVVPVQDGMGAFVRRQNAGAGNLEWLELTLQLQEELPSGSYEIRLFAIEMVYVPQGSFWLGDGQSFNRFRAGADSGAFEVTSAGAISVGNSSGKLSHSGKYPISGDIPAAYPNGFDGFYCMKYELSQEQYADFLNTLTYTQQEMRTSISPDAAEGTLALAHPSAPGRNGVVIKLSGTAPGKPAVYTCNATPALPFAATDDGQNRACNFLSWADLCAYLDWSGLRPMTEPEFEKACRGPELPVPLEFAWGTPYVTDGNTIVNDGLPTETVTEKGDDTTGLASHGYDGPQGALRCGFAAQGNNGRSQTGASFYGIMEMSGNLWEICVTVNAEGLTFTGIHGDGNLTPTGEADAARWIPAGDGAGHRGGAWLSGISPQFRDLATSDRFYGGLKPVIRRSTGGGRGVRTFQY
ncbi:MAG: SUMF1/EgtB/PvdO family nonheme iron enzyme [Bacteroidia bacterium]